MKAECPHKNDPQMITKSLQGRKIYKDQCVRCFHQPTKPEGLFVCMKCFNGFCPEDRDQHSVDHKHYLYYHHKKILKQSEEKVQITKLAIGVQGGASAGPQYINQYQLYCSQCKAFDFEGAQAFEAQKQSFINTETSYKQELAVAWELSEQPCEHTLTIEQAPINKDFSKCMKCDLSTNLWLCLTCGSTGCARKNWDGSGGNNHGVQHYQQTKHPLVVKLGTITADGNASINCYTCDKDVKDNYLKDHLSILGINMQDQKKTEKTMAELNVQMNLNLSLSRLIDGGKQESIPMYGKGYTGINNIGNSCYLNSVVQALNSLDEFREQYYVKGVQHMKTCKRIPINCFFCQVSKVAWGLNDGKYSEKLMKTRVINDIEQTEEYQEGIKPFHFKQIIADKNQDFSSGEQQDALEYMQWLLDRLGQQQPKYNGNNTPKLFDYYSTNVLVCTKCNGQKHINEKTNQMKFPIPAPTQKDIEAFYQSLQKQTNKDMKQSKLAEDPVYDVSFDVCRKMLLNGDSRLAFCPKCEQNVEFVSRPYFKTTPKYLMMIPNRFYLDDGYMQKKLNAILDMPEELNLSEFLLKNAVHGGEMMKEEKKKKYDQGSVAMIVEMGQTRNAAIRALMANHGNVQTAINWIFENMDQPNINDPVPDDEEEGDANINQADVQQVIFMGFNDQQAKVALIKNNSDVAGAIEWLFNCGGDVSAFSDLLKPKKKVEAQIVGNVSEKFVLKAVILHLGKTPHHGHYVVYIKKQGKWVLFNDESVTVPKSAVLGKGYIYIYESL